MSKIPQPATKTPSPRLAPLDLLSAPTYFRATLRPLEKRRAGVEGPSAHRFFSIGGRITMRTVDVTAGEIEIHSVGGVVLLSTFCLGDDVEMTADQAQQLAGALISAAAEAKKQSAGEARV